MERFSVSHIQEPTAFTSQDPMSIYNNILVFIVGTGHSRSEMHIFQVCYTVTVLRYIVMGITRHKACALCMQKIILTEQIAIEILKISLYIVY